MPNILNTITLLAFAASLCSGHEGDRVVPVFEIPDNLVSGIDIHDGDVQDWLDVIGEPSLTGLDLIPDTIFGEEYNPSDFDFRIWLGWNRGLHRFYIAAQGIDDVPVYRGNVGDHEWYWDSIIKLGVDGDHSGGVFAGGHGDKPEDLASQWQGVQQFYGGPFHFGQLAVSMSTSEGLLWYLQERCCWFSEPPFADVGSAAYGENPTVWVTEMYVTPFDRLVLDSRDETLISELRPERIIGFALTLFDQDDPQRGNPDGVYYLPNPESNQGPDQFADGLLVPVGRSAGSAVESVTWGRIKTSLQR